MKNSKRKILTAIALTVSVFMTVLYYSCEKTGNALPCDGISCQNGGYCLKGQCICPTGYEDSTCSTAIVQKYFGSWNVTQKVVGSDSSLINDTTYTMFIKASSTPTAFFLYNFMGNYEYNKVVCTLDPTNSFHFTIDTTANAAMWYANIHFYGGQGLLYHKDTISGGFKYKHLNKYTTWVVDTVSLFITRIK